MFDVMPDPTINNGVFDYLTSLDFIDPESNNMDYLYNRSGLKVPSPLVLRLADGDTLTSVSLQSLARIIKVRFEKKWTRIWEDYVTTSPLWNTLDITEQKTGSGTTRDTTNDSSYLSRSQVETKSRDTTDTTTLSGSHDDTTTATDSSTTTRSGTVSETEGGTTTEAKSTSGNSITRTQHEGTIGDTTSSAGENSVWGFNSTSAVKTNSQTSADGTLRTYDNTDTTTESPSTNDITATAHGRTNTTSYNDMKDGISSNTTGTTTRKYNNETSATSHTGSDTTSGTTTDSTTREQTKSGSTQTSATTHTYGFNIRNLSDKTEIMKLLYTDPLFNNFWEVVYTDIDEVLTCPIFV